VRRLHAYLQGEFPFTAGITIADNGSDDGTWAVACALEAEFSLVRAVRIERPGRGGALRSVWLASDADIFAYMDVDLSTDLNALLPLVSGHSDVAIGTRLASGARVIRGPRREIISRCYNVLLHATLGTRFSDAQCGFKAIRADQARALLISQLARFLVIGGASTAAYLVLYLLLRDALGAQPANAVSLLITAVANTAVNRRLTFGIRGSRGAVRHQVLGLITFGIGLALTSGALDIQHAASPRAGRVAEVTVLVIANLLATVIRFGLYRGWVFRDRPSASQSSSPKRSSQ
jgi:putative flippase GtrA